MLAFGGASRWKGDARDEIRSRPLEDFIRDVAYGTRALRRNPGFATIAVLTLALGIAATVTGYRRSVDGTATGYPSLPSARLSARLSAAADRPIRQRSRRQSPIAGSRQ